MSEQREMVSEEVRDALPTQEFQDVEIIHTKSGKIAFILHAPRVDRYDRQNRAAFYGGVEVDFYEEGEPTSHMTADRGEVLGGGSALYAVGNVIIRADNGTLILTPKLRWSRDEELIRSDTIVTIITEWDTLTGTGLIASQDLKNKRILQPTGVSLRAVQYDQQDSEDPGELEAGLNPEDDLEADSAHHDSAGSSGEAYMTMEGDTAYTPGPDIPDRDSLSVERRDSDAVETAMPDSTSGELPR